MIHSFIPLKILPILLVGLGKAVKGICTAEYKLECRCLVGIACRYYLYGVEPMVGNKKIFIE